MPKKAKVKIRFKADKKVQVLIRGEVVQEGCLISMDLIEALEKAEKENAG